MGAVTGAKQREPSRRKSSHRINFVHPLQGSRAPWDHVLAVAASRELAAAAAREARVTYREARGPNEEPAVRQGPAAEVCDVPAGRLAPVRRPTAYRGMPNGIGRLAVPNQDGPAAVWVESLHEMAQVKDQWLTEPTRSVMTQPFRLEFVWAQGVRSRVPDFVADLSTGERVLVDVTSARVLKDPQRAAAFALTGVWARSVGMRYELRMEMPRQRQRERNLSFLWCHFGQHGRPDPEFLDVVGPRCPLTVKAAAKALGGGRMRYMCGPRCFIRCAPHLLQRSASRSHSGTVDAAAAFMRRRRRRPGFPARSMARG